MPISGTYYFKKWLPDAKLVHGDDFQGGAPGGPGGPGGEPPKDMPMPPMGAEKPKIDLADHGTPPANYFEGDMTLVLEPHPIKDGLDAGTLTGTADGSPINFGFYTGSEFFKVDYPAGPGRWEVWARVADDGTFEGMISVGGNGGFPNLVYGKKID